MILSVKHQFIYFANARTATTSWESLLRGMDESALVIPELQEIWEADDFLRTQNFRHVRPRLIRSLMDKDQWNCYFKFAFVRNPWDWCLSQYFRNYLAANRRLDRNTVSSKKALLKFISHRREAKNFERFGEREFGKIWKRMHRFRGVESDDNYFQSQFVVDEEGQEMLDFVGRFESLEADSRFVLDKLGMKDAAIPVQNKSRGKAEFTQYYTEQAKELVSDRYAQDIELLGYRAW